MLIRPITQDDLPALIDLARGAGIGVTTLQPDEERLALRVQVSLDSFAGKLPPSQANYLFVLKSGTHDGLAGASGIAAAVGLDEPWYNYRVGTAVYCSREIGI